MERESAQLLDAPRPSRASFLPGLWDHMTPHDWHTGDSTWGMFMYLWWNVAWSRWWRGLRPSQLLGPRKRRLLAVAAVRPHWDLLGDEERRRVNLSEAYADGLISWWVLRDLPGHAPRKHAGVSDVELFARYAASESAADWLTWDGLSEALRYSILAAAWARPYGSSEWNETRLATCRRHCDLARDMAGDPFDPAPQGWAARFRDSPRIGGLAAAIYRDRAFHEMPSLGDALEEEGCSVSQVLRHCREPGEHVRGCWVVDDLLGLPA